ncbi:Flavodoxin reductases (ferredoxin-NADPH reductases) family 1 [Geitlerinema sp. FC II]|nr:Flavodoxin reductases (ferredoxin-NADPH reductases) family 1 [Geitlerinema sp. FC II]
MKQSVGTRHEPAPTAVSANAAPDSTSLILEKSTVIRSIMAAEKPHRHAKSPRLAQ